MVILLRGNDVKIEWRLTFSGELSDYSDGRLYVYCDSEDIDVPFQLVDNVLYATVAGNQLKAGVYSMVFISTGESQFLRKKVSKAFEITEDEQSVVEGVVIADSSAYGRTMYSLTDVLSNRDNDSVEGAKEGNVLTYTNGLWRGMPSKGGSGGGGGASTEYIDTAIQSIRDYIDGLIYLKDGTLFTDYPFASLKSIATKGIGGSSSGGSGTIPWSEVPMSILPANNTLDLGSNAKPWDRVFSSYFGTDNNHTIITGTSVNIVSDLYFSNGIDHIDTDGNAYLHSIYMDDELVATEAWVNNKLGAYATTANTYTKTQVNNNFAAKSEARIDVSTTIVGSRVVKPTLTLTDGDSSWSMDVAKASGSNAAITKYCVYSEGHGLMELSQSGDMWLNGRLTQSSDETLKNILSYNVDMKVKDIANAPACYFTWKDRVSDRQIGTIAQYWKLITPECVVGEEGRMSMDYSTLGLVSSIINAREIVKHEDEIEALKRRVKELEDKLAVVSAA